MADGKRWTNIGEHDFRFWATGKLFMFTVILGLVLFVVACVGTVPVVINIVYVHSLQSVPCRLLSANVVPNAAADVRCFSGEECAAIRCTVNAGDQIPNDRPIYWATLDYWPVRRLFKSIGSQEQMERIVASGETLRVGGDYVCLLTSEGISGDLVFLLGSGNGATWAPWNLWASLVVCLIVLLPILVVLLSVGIVWLPQTRKLRHYIDHRTLIAPHRMEGAMTFQIPPLPPLPSFSRGRPGNAGVEGIQSEGRTSATRRDTTSKRIEPSGRVLGRE